MAPHLGDADVPVPVGDFVTITRRGDAVDTVQPVRRRDDLWAILAILVEARVVLSRAPRIEDRLGRGVERRRQGNDGAHVEIAIGPAIQALADAGCKRVVHGGVAQGTGKADSRQRIRSCLLYTSDAA